MNWQRTEGVAEKTIATTKEKAGPMVGSRHPEAGRQEERREAVIGSGKGRAMDAVREVVHSEGNFEETERPNRKGDIAMDAVRQVVEKE